MTEIFFKIVLTAFMLLFVTVGAGKFTVECCDGDYPRLETVLIVAAAVEFVALVVSILGLIWSL